jgi:hypothetical protein
MKLRITYTTYVALIHVLMKASKCIFFKGKLCNYHLTHTQHLQA